ncbi:hypothetical protein BC940DRAFT_354457 [Gongronella butleri]|nr:hypothetical protein BC940DRAFT_354457 [Gongronella butleri]
MHPMTRTRRRRSSSSRTAPVTYSKRRVRGPQPEITPPPPPPARDMALSSLTSLPSPHRGRRFSINRKKIVVFDMDEKIKAFWEAHPSIALHGLPSPTPEPQDPSSPAATAAVQKDKTRGSPMTNEKSRLNETSMAPQVRLIDGKIVLDTSSLFVQVPELQTGDYEVVEMDDAEIPHVKRRRSSSSSSSNSSSQSLKKTASMGANGNRQRRWTIQETDLFYNALHKHGVNFERIAHMIPQRSRRQVRGMFMRQLSDSPDRVAQALQNRSGAFTAAVQQKSQESATISQPTST